MSVSIVVPIYNEYENIPLLYDELKSVLSGQEQSYEVLFVDDGSTDGSDRLLFALATQDSHVRVLRFRGNFGQTAAMQAGLEHSTGDVVVTLDGDLQNDPADIPLLLQKIDEGYDLVHGWRKHRQDAWLSRKLPSKIANALISWSTGMPIHDLGCTLKAVRREIADELELYGQMHRFIPVLAAQRGAKCVEVVTHHRARKFGKSKYGLSRTLQVLLDLCTVKYMQNYFANPMKLFGKMATASFLVAGLALAATVTMKLTGNVDMTGNPLLLLSVFCLLASTQLMSLGLLGEVSARLYYRRDGNRPFSIGKTAGFAPAAERPSKLQRAA